MKNLVTRIITLSLFCFVSLSVSAQVHGKVIETLTINSKILNRAVVYTMYLPPDYETSSRTYPIVYLLHGYTDDNTGWLQFGEINRYADKAIEEGTIPPMIIAMPNADSGWYINSYDGKENYEDFFVKEFMPEVEKKFRVKAKKNIQGYCRFIDGWLRYTDLFHQIP